MPVSTANALANVRPYRWEYADATARTSDTGFVSADLGKFARQLSDNSLWMLTATTPTWVAVGTAGALLAANNLSDVASAATSRTNLGLGTASTHPTGDFAQTANNLSDLASASTARTNLGLGALATKSAAAEGDLSLSDVTTANVSTTKHGFAPKAPNDATKYLDGTGAWSAPPGTGTVTSVALTMPGDFSVSGSPVTGAGTLAVTAATQSANTVKAGPSTGSPAAPTYRALVHADLPSTDANPMSAQDDLIVGGASGAPTRLAKGADGQVLTINASTHHVDWENPAGGYTDPLTTKGDLVGRTSSATTRIGVGTNGQVLTANSAAATGVNWADPASAPATPPAVLALAYINASLSFR